MPRGEGGWGRSDSVAPPRGAADAPRPRRSWSARAVRRHGAWLGTTATATAGASDGPAGLEFRAGSSARAPLAAASRRGAQRTASADRGRWTAVLTSGPVGRRTAAGGGDGSRRRRPESGPARPPTSTPEPSAAPPSPRQCARGGRDRPLPLPPVPVPRPLPQSSGAPLASRRPPGRRPHHSAALIGGCRPRDSSPVRALALALRRCSLKPRERPGPLCAFIPPPPTHTRTCPGFAWESPLQRRGKCRAGGGGQAPRRRWRGPPGRAAWARGGTGVGGGGGCT